MAFKRSSMNNHYLKKAIRRFCNYFIFLFISICYLSANPEADIVTLNFTTFSLSGKLNKLCFISDGKIIEFDTSQYRRSKELKYTGGRIISFYQKTGNNPNDIELVTNVQIRKNMQRPLILFAKDNNGINALIIEDEVSIFKAGSIRFINLTKNTNDLIIAFGENAQIRKVLPPNELITYNISNKDIGNLRLQIAGIDKNKQPRILKDAIIFPELKARYIYFIYQPEKRKDYYKVSMLKEPVF